MSDVFRIHAYNPTRREESLRTVVRRGRIMGKEYVAVHGTPVPGTREQREEF